MNHLFLESLILLCGLSVASAADGGKDQVILTGEMQGPDGKMVTMMRATGTRKK